jgi:hypothetical protein
VADERGRRGRYSVVGVLRRSFPHKLIRLCFAKQESTLLAAAERLNTL